MSGRTANITIALSDKPGQLADVSKIISQTGANDVYHVRFADGKTRYLPAIPQVVISTDIEGGVMTIRPLEGLFDD